MLDVISMRDPYSESSIPRWSPIYYNIKEWFNPWSEMLHYLAMLEVLADVWFVRECHRRFFSVTSHASADVITGTESPKPQEQAPQASEED